MDLVVKLFVEGIEVPVEGVDALKNYPWRKR